MVGKITEEELHSSLKNTINNKAEKDDINNINSRLEQNIRYASEILNQNGYKFIGHMGVKTLSVENTLPSFDLAGKLGFYGIECDIQWTSDNVPVIIHDREIQNTTTSTGNIDEMTLVQVKEAVINKGSKIADYGSALRIPTLEEYIKVCKKWNAIPFIEIKPHVMPTSANYNILIDIIKKHGLEERCVIMCGNKTCLNEIRNRSKLITLIWWASDTYNVADVDYLKSIYPSSIAINSNLSLWTQDKIDTFKNEGIKVTVATMDYAHVTQQWIDRKVDFLISNWIIL